MKRLHRSTTDRMWWGVCGGLGEYFEIDPVLVRAFFVIGAVPSFGLVALLYLVLAILMPLAGSAAGTVPATAESSGSDVAQPLVGERGRELAGWLLIAFGLLALITHLGILDFISLRMLWPLGLIALGVFLIVQRSRR